MNSWETDVFFCLSAVNCALNKPHCFVLQLPSHPLTPSRHAEGRGMTVAPTYHTLPHPSSHGTSHSTMMWGPLEPPNTPKPWSLSCLRPAPPLRPSAALCYKEVSDWLCLMCCMLVFFKFLICSSLISRILVKVLRVSRNFYPSANLRGNSPRRNLPWERVSLSF